MNHLQWPLEGDGYIRIEWPERLSISACDCDFMKEIFKLLLRKFKRCIKPEYVAMKVGSIELKCLLNRR